MKTFVAAAAMFVATTGFAEENAKGPSATIDSGFRVSVDAKTVIKNAGEDITKKLDEEKDYTAALKVVGTSVQVELYEAQKIGEEEVEQTDEETRSPVYPPRPPRVAKYYSNILVPSSVIRYGGIEAANDYCEQHLLGRDYTLCRGGFFQTCMAYPIVGAYYDDRSRRCILEIPAR